MKKLALSGIMAFAATSALAQTAVASKYYVVLDTATNTCAIVDQRPNSAAHSVDDKIYFKTRSEAETGMQSMKACRMARADSGDNQLR
jgi:hypothetical protein